MSKLKVGILYGGKSTEHEVSIRSAKSVLAAINQDKYDVVLIYISKAGEWLLAEDASAIKILSPEEKNVISFNPARGLEANHHDIPLDAAIPVLHGTAGEDGKVQSVLELLDIPYAGCNVRSSALCMDKDMTKRLLTLEDINVADSVVVNVHDKDQVKFEKVTDKLQLPLFIKPVNQGSSVGVSKVTDEASFYQALDIAFSFDTKVMIETGIQGREIEISVLGNEQPFVSLPGEIISETGFYSYDSKYIDDDGAVLQIPAELDDKTIKDIQETAVKTFKALDCEGMARVDVFLTEDNEVIVNEVNTLPGFTSISMYPKLLEVSGVEYTELIDRLIELALERYQLESQLTTDFVD
jgi:D-alanine-D-alanine ligase